jgi:hypothetical protein
MRIVLTLLLMIAAAPAWADWVLVSTNDSVDSFADSASLEVQSSFWGMRFSRVGNRVVKVRQLMNFKIPQRSNGSWVRPQGSNPEWNGTYMSLKSSVVYDCDSSEFELLRYDAYTGPMGSGTHEGTYWWTTSARSRGQNKAKWEPVAPGSKEAAFLNFVCRKM